MGNLVAGVAHEVNTPLGVSITAQSVIADELKVLNTKIDNDDLSIEDMEEYRLSTQSALKMMEANLERACELISNFKKTASDQHSLEMETLKLDDYYKQVLSTIKPILKSKHIKCRLCFNDDIVTKRYPVYMLTY